MDQIETRPRVGFFEAIIKAFKNYVNCNGRARRSEFWYFYLLIAIINIILIIIMISTLEKKEETSYRNGYVIYYYYYKVNPILSAISYILTAVYICPLISCAVRRLHDIGVFGGYLLIIFIPIYGLIKLFITLSKDSTLENNQFGPCPKYITIKTTSAPLNNQLYTEQNTNDIQLNINPQENPYPQPQQMPSEIPPAGYTSQPYA